MPNISKGITWSFQAGACQEGGDWVLFLRLEGGSDCLLLDFGLKIRNPNMIRYRWRSAMKDDFRFGVTTVRMIPSKSQDFWKVDGRNSANQSIPRRSNFS